MEKLLINNNQKSIQYQNAELKLSDKAFNLVECLASAHGAAVSRDEILRTVWGTEHKTENLVNQLIADVRQQLGTIEGSHLITAERNQGYALKANVEWRSPISLWMRRHAATLIAAPIALTVMMTLSIYTFFPALVNEPFPEVISLSPLPGFKGDLQSTSSSGEYVAIYRRDKNGTDIVRSSDGTVVHHIKHKLQMTAWGNQLDTFVFIRFDGQQCEIWLFDTRNMLESQLARCKEQFADIRRAQPHQMMIFSHKDKKILKVDFRTRDAIDTIDIKTGKVVSRQTLPANPQPKKIDWVINAGDKSLQMVTSHWGQNGQMMQIESLDFVDGILSPIMPIYKIKDASYAKFKDYILYRNVNNGVSCIHVDSLLTNELVAPQPDIIRGIERLSNNQFVLQQGNGYKLFFEPLINNNSTPLPSYPFRLVKSPVLKNGKLFFIGNDENGTLQAYSSNKNGKLTQLTQFSKKHILTNLDINSKSDSLVMTNERHALINGQLLRKGVYSAQFYTDRQIIFARLMSSEAKSVEIILLDLENSKEKVLTELPYIPVDIVVFKQQVYFIGSERLDRWQPGKMIESVNQAIADELFAKIPRTFSVTETHYAYSSKAGEFILYDRLTHESTIIDEQKSTTNFQIAYDGDTLIHVDSIDTNMKRTLITIK